MRLPVLLRILSRMLFLAAAILGIVLVFSLLHHEGIWKAYALPAAGCLLLGLGVGLLPSVHDADVREMRRRESMVAVTCAWLILVLAGAISFQLSGHFPLFAHSLFESMSGFTTTGASVLSNLEALPPSIPLLRGLSHWVGGMGIIVLAVAILPELKVGGMQLFSAESSGLSGERIAPHVRQTAQKLWALYVGLTILQTILLLLGGMSLYEALLHSFATVATGGFSNRTDSVAAYHSLYIEIVIMAFMFISAISFTLLHASILGKRPKRLFQSSEVRLYLALTLGGIVLVTWNLMANGIYHHMGQALRDASFQVVSVASTTGFATADFDAWPEFSRMIFLLLMAVGGCAGSTAGGIKVVRVYAVIQNARVQLRRLVRPRLAQVISISNRDVTPDMTQGILGFFVLYFLVAAVATLALTSLHMSIVDAFSATISCLNSVGPGLGVVGPVRNYAGLSPTALYILSTCMFLGRLELFTVLVFFSRHFWRQG